MSAPRSFFPGDIFVAQGGESYMLIRITRGGPNIGRRWLCLTTNDDGRAYEMQLDEHTLERWAELEQDVFAFFRSP